MPTGTITQADREEAAFYRVNPAHVVGVSLENADGLRLSLSIEVAGRNTPYENAACVEAEVRANADPEHRKYGPWVAKSSRFLN